jgi:hypothetical protein
MLKKQIIRAIGGLNRDDDPRYLAEGDYLEMLNFRVGSNQEQGDRGLIEQFLSHYRIEITGITPANFKFLAVIKEEEHDEAFFLCFYDTTPNDLFQIFKLNILTDAITKIYEALASTWGITASTKIYNPRILDRKLVWTDNTTSIKYVDVDRLETSYVNGIGLTSISKWASATTYGVGTIIYWGKSYYASLQAANTNNLPDESPSWWDELCLILDAYGDIVNPDNFMLAAAPPLLAPVPQYVNTAGREANNLRQQIFQVTYRYVYIDYRKSTYAPPSIVPPPDQEETIDGLFNPSQTYHNGLLIQVNTGNEEVRSIEIVGRSSEDPTAWFGMGEVLLFDRDGNRNIDTEQTFNFYWYNDATKQVVDATLIYSLFTFIPVRTKHLELIEGNRLAFANMVEGYDRIQPYVTVDLSWEDLAGQSTVNEKLDVQAVIVGGAGGGWFSFIWQLKLTLPTVPKFGLYHIDIVNEYAVHFIAEYNYTTGAYPLTVKNGLIAAINAAGWGTLMNVCSSFSPETGPSDYKICFFNYTTYNLMDVPFSGWNYVDFSVRTVAGVSAVNKYPSLKKGTTQSWGIVYRDEAGRLSPIIGASEIVKYIPYPTESPSINTAQRAIVDFNIGHLPPAWAKSYEIVYSGNKTISWFLHLLGYGLTYGHKPDLHTEPNRLTYPDTRLYRVSVEDMYSRTRNKLSNWSVEQYVWEKGDRIRIIGTVDFSGGVTELTSLFDAEVVGVYKDTDYVSPWANSGTTVERDYLYFQIDTIIAGASTPDFTRGFPDVLIELYRPYKEFSTTLYYTTGMTFDIGVDQYGHKYHKGTTDQVLDSAGEPVSFGIVRNTAHDSWMYFRNFMDKLNDTLNYFWIESEFASDFYISQKMTSSGVPIPDLYNFKQSILTKRVRHGGLYNFGTELNNIAKFDYDEYKDVKDEFGPIEGIREVGFILKIIQYNRVSSIYLSRTESYSPDGSQQFLFTNKVFGSLRPGMEQYGTRHPESVIVYNQHLYFWDQSEGAVIRDAANGIFPISKYKMMQFFIDKAKALESVGYDEGAVRFAYNVYDDTLFCTFFDGTLYETLTFSEQEQRWKFSTDAKIEKPFWFGKRMFHVSAGSIYEWWRVAEAGFLRLSNEVKSARLIFPVNEDPMKLKHYNALAVYQIGAIPIASVKVPAKGSAVGRDQQTIASQWVKKEGVFYGHILRDINTPGLTGNNNKYMNGIRMRGQYCEVTLEVTLTTDKVTIYNIMVMATDSERSM